MQQITARTPVRGPTPHALRSPKAKAALAVAGGVLAAAAIGNVIATRRTERRNPPAGRFVIVDGVRVHYLERGEGPALVLIHGNGVTLQDYVLSGLFDALSVHNRVIAFDRPGFGHTERPRDRLWTARNQAQLLLGALAQLGVERSVLAAHSWGTLVALQAALEQPDRVAGLVLMSGYYWPTARADAALVSGPAIPVLGDVLRFTISPPLGRLMMPLVIKQMFSPAKVPTHFRDGFAADMALRPSQLRATAADTAMMPFEAGKLAPRLREITAPVLVMSGDSDKIVSFEHQSRRLASELLGGQLQVLKGAGHMIHHAAPGDVRAGVEDFLEQTGHVSEARRRADSLSISVPPVALGSR
jgi:pimeloyl-ACP methyl ester carboxylesterase